MGPEMPFLAAGAITMIGGVAHEKHWPKNASRAIVGTVALVFIASATGDTPLAPLVHAVGILVLVVALIAAIRLNMQGGK